MEAPERIAKYRTLWEQHEAVALGPEQTRCFLLELQVPGRTAEAMHGENDATGGHVHEHAWRKSSRSGANGQCVEVGLAEDAVLVRDTKDRAGGTLVFTRRQWRRFRADPGLTGASGQ